MQATRASSNRLQYLDWVRGLGAIIMLQGHVFDSFLKPDLRPGEAYTMSQFVGGMPPALFLFLTGVTYAFLMDSTSRKGLPAGERVLTALGRSRYLFLLAFAFRLQLFIFGLPADWQGLFRVDVLNCMGFSMAALALMSLLSTRQRAWVCGASGLAIAFAAPLVSQLNWTHVPWMLRNYIAPGLGSFSFFPWGGYLAFGLSMGSLIRLAREEGSHRLMQWSAVAGGGLVLAGQYVAGKPYSLYAKSDFWLNSPAQMLIKLGVLLLLVAVAFVWTRYGAGDGWSWVRQFGITSLLVYWVHIELVYGRELWFLKNNLTVPQTVVAAGGMILLMLAISTAKTHWHRVRAVLDELGWAMGPPKPDRIAAD
jgi:uncharacterized membrane protein